MVESRAARIFPSQWQLKGGCQKTGECCKLIVLEMPAFLKMPALFRLARKWGIWWHERINGFTYAGEEAGGALIGFTCKRLGKNHLCLDYKNRPRVCREYPQVRYYGKPRLYKGCGFYFSLRAQKPKIFRG